MFKVRSKFKYYKQIFYQSQEYSGKSVKYTSISVTKINNKVD